MPQNKNPYAKNTLSHFSPSSGSTVKQNPGGNTLGSKQTRSQNSAKLINEKNSGNGNKVSVTKAVYSTHTQEISFEAFLKSKPKNPSST